MMSRMCSRARRALSSASLMILKSSPSVLISIWIEVTPCRVPATLKSISPSWSSVPRMSVRTATRAPSLMSPIATPAQAAERQEHGGGRLPAGDQRRAMGARQHAHLAADRAHRVEVAPVDALAARQDLLPHRGVLDLLEDRHDVLRVVRELGAELLPDGRLEGRERLRPLRLFGQVERLGHPRFRELPHPR